MARMVPSDYKVERTSYGEQQVFHALTELPASYTVFHSYSLNCHTGKLFAEIDFVILCPQGVLCLEVKGGQIKCVERQWYSYGQGQSRLIENPFVQAQTAAMALRKAVTAYFRANRSVVDVCFASGVAFPDIVFNERGPETRPEIVYDKTSGDFAGYIKRVIGYWTHELSTRLGIKTTGLGAGARDQLENYLARDFEIAYTVGTKVEQVEKETIRLTDGQRQILDYLAGNPRLLITGGAGTGKTILCLQQAQRWAYKGKRVLLLCFNHNLANHLRHRVQVQNPDIAGSLQVFAFYKYIQSALTAGDCLPTQPDPAAKDESERYWQTVLPQAFIAHPFKDQFDALVIDEGQDLLDPLKLLCIDGLLKGGLDQGQWLTAMDPLQNIYRADLTAGLELLDKGRPVLVSLEDNFRNTCEIISYTIKSTGVDPKVKPLIGGLAIREDVYHDNDEQRLKLVKALERLKKEAVPAASICIVSLTSFASSVLRGHPRIGKFAVQDLTDLTPEEWDPDRIKFSSVYRFKGMESPVVIVTDVSSTRDQFAPRCYTAMTRAKALLWVLKKSTTAG